ncbi:hypothetical protein DPMN_020661 [Dreissena polymorpha]|uniref:Uncharacterized protein n=1 Tax=Dreissena polymorpha TaxID=45954 RepID=A0A9D4NMJ3_DREPO|nr:hypothetical protein DPMN_020661 [Dreissena polymorpha]
MSYLHGEASLILGLQTLLLWGRDYLIHKGHISRMRQGPFICSQRPYTHKFRPRERRSPTTTQPVRLNKGHPS